MRLKKLIALFFISVATQIHAQDAGFRLPTEEKPKASAGGGSGSNTGNAGASLLNNMDQLDNTYELNLGDRVSFRIVEERLPNPESLKVTDSGDILAKHIGPVRAVGRTCRDIAFQVKSTLERTVFVKATVIIVLDEKYKNKGGDAFESESETFTVFGQVLRQGKYILPVDEDVSISQAILRAGGPAQFAKLKKVKIMRRLPNGNTKTILVNVEGIMVKGNLDKDIFIRDGDVIIIPEKKVSI
jgi:polysaccharide biosynthesis/export protein